jgi:hypothetical protein
MISFALRSTFRNFVACKGKEPLHMTNKTRTKMTDNSSPYETPTQAKAAEAGKNRLWVYMAIVLTLLAGAGTAAYLLFFREGACPLEVQKPQWEKFVMVTASDAPLHKEASFGSARLTYLMENIESDVCDFLFRWEDEPDRRGYTRYPFHLEEKQVLPVIEETDRWYKVLVTSDMIGLTEAYLAKKHCEEVKPAPITADVLDQIDEQEGRCDYLIAKGKWKNLCLSCRNGDMDELEFSMGVLQDGVLLFPEANPVMVMSGMDNEGISLDEQDNNGTTILVINYGEAESWENDHASVLDTHLFRDDDVDQVFNALKKDNPAYVMAEYYFPDANEDRLYSFTYTINDTPNVKENESENESVRVTGYRTIETEDGCQLLAELGETSEETKISDYCQLLVTVTGDFDGNGDMEAVIQESCGGNAGDNPPYVVYYDKDTQSYHTTESFGLSREVVMERKGGQVLLVQREGIYEARYVFDGHLLTLKEEKTQDTGQQLKQWECERLFDTSQSGPDKELYYDLDGDGTDETLVFSHDTSHAFGWGMCMRFASIGRSNGTFIDDTGLFPSTKLTVLQPMTNGMHDLLLDEHYLFRWNGSSYEQWVWNGSKLVRENDE